MNRTGAVDKGGSKGTLRESVSPPVFLLRRLVLLGALSVLLAGVWTGIYASSRGLTESWRRAIRGELADQGIELSMGRLTLDPFHGLVARDVRFYEDAGHDRVLAEISQIDLDVSIPRLFRKEVSLNRLQVRGAEASIPLDPDDPGARRLEIEDFHARVVLDDSQVEVQELRGRILGVMCNFTGEVVRGGDGGSDESAPFLLGESLGPAQAEMIARILEVVDRAEMPGGEATLKVRAVADADRLEEGRYDFAFSAPALAWGDYMVEEAAIAGNYEDGLLVVEDARFRDHGGSFRGQGDYVRATRRVSFNIDSHAILPETVRRSLWPDGWPEMVVTSSPALSLGGEMVLRDGAADPSAPPFEGMVTGSFALGAHRIAGVPLDYASGAFSFDGRRCLVRGLKARAPGGTLEGRLLWEDGGLRAAVVSMLAPSVYAALAPDKDTRWVLDAIESDPESVHRVAARLQGSPADPSTFVLEADLEVAGVRMHGTPISQGSARMVVADGEIRFENPSVTVPAGAPLALGDAVTPGASIATADLVSLRPGVKLMTRIEGLACRGWPRAVLAAFLPVTARVLPPLRFDQGTILEAEGTVMQDLIEGTDLRLMADVGAKGTAYWPFMGKDLPLQGAKSSMRLKGSTLEIESLRATLYGGPVAGGFLITGVDKQRPACKGQIALQGANYQQLMQLFSDREDKAQGRIDLDFTFETADCSPETLDGRGSMSLVNGDLFSIPLFGPLSPLVDAVLPDAKIGYSVASRAGCTFAVEKGLLRTDDFEALTPSFQMNGGGAIRLTDRGVDFWARLNARGPAKVATVVFSYIFEYRCGGTVDEPVWRPAHLPRLPDLPDIPRPNIPLPRLPMPDLGLPRLPFLPGGGAGGAPEGENPKADDGE